MRVISLVPSWTETLLRCGVEVVGRTRFCIHPESIVEQIPIVGGTKNVDWQACAKLKPDLVIFDKEENNKQMADDCPYEWYATHVNSLTALHFELNQLAMILANDKLHKLAIRLKRILTLPNLEADCCDIYGQITAINPMNRTFNKLQYIIWRKPWMAINRDTYIGSVLAKLGFADYLCEYEEQYPVLDDEQMLDKETFYLFSSEPYPFAKHKIMLEKTLSENGVSGAIVNGELYSWFGIRSIDALEKLYKKQ